MGLKIKRRIRACRRAIKRLRKPRTWHALQARIAIASGLLLTLLIIAGMMTPKPIDSAAYQPLLDTIAKGESGGNYNAHFGNAANTTTTFTDMTVAQVLVWQEQYVASGSISSAAGKYQIVPPTLLGLIAEHDIDTNRLFDKALQDELAIKLLERRGAKDYMRGKLSRNDFAANLAKEWAALPKITGPNPNDSYYAGDGVNASRINVNEMFAALQQVHERAKN